MGCIVAGALLLAAMVAIELRVATPLLDLRVYADRLFRSASIVLTLTSVAFFSAPSTPGWTSAPEWPSPRPWRR
jgi:hypothetical protein